MVVVFQFGVILILSKTITCWLAQGQSGGTGGNPASCTSSSCGDHGFCGMHSGTCHCHTGYSGSHCEVDVCSSNPCQNGGHCHHRSNGRGYECYCIHHYTGDNCEVAHVTSAIETTQTMTPATSPTTTPTPLTTAATNTKPSPTTTQTTTLVPSFTTKCSKFVTVLDLAEEVIETSILAAPCSSGNHSSHEAFVTNICHLGIPSTWKQGISVMTFCDKIPAYTPIASFENGKYSSADSRSGIFIGCLHGPDGFKAAFQRCDEVAEIESVMVGDVMFNNNPHNFFTVES